MCWSLSCVSYSVDDDQRCPLNERLLVLVTPPIYTMLTWNVFQSLHNVGEMNFNPVLSKVFCTMLLKGCSDLPTFIWW